MLRSLKIKVFVSLLTMFLVSLGLTASANAQVRKAKASLGHEAATDQPLFTEYKGVRLGMSAEETRARLGTPTLQGNDQDYYVFSENETAQIVYNADAAPRVVTISVDYLAGIGAPDYKTVVGGELESLANGSLYRIVRYESLGFWVSYNRTAGPVATVTVTIQKI